jgi:Domain of unknown function (DUF4296)
MKKIIVILSILIIGACGNKSEDQKPKKIIDKAVMKNILYDLALLQAIRSYSPEKFDKNNINPKTYIYQKYKIDSLQFAQNNKYYASDMESYKVMFQSVTDRLKIEKDALDTIIKRKERAKSKRLKDSMIKVTKKKKIVSDAKPIAKKKKVKANPLP